MKNSSNKHPFHEVVSKMLHTDKTGYFIKEPNVSSANNNAISTLMAAIAVAISTKISDLGILVQIVAGIRKQIKNLGLSHNLFLFKTVLDTMEARVGTGVYNKGLRPFHDSVIAVMDNIGADGDMITMFDTSPTAAFSFLCDLVAESEIPKDNLHHVLMKMTENAKRLGFGDLKAFTNAVRSLKDQMESANVIDKQNVTNTTAESFHSETVAA